MFHFSGSVEHDLIYPLSVINTSDLGVLSDDEIKNYLNYLSGGNKAITREEIIDQIVTNGGITKITTHFIPSLPQLSE